MNELSISKADIAQARAVLGLPPEPDPPAPPTPEALAAETGASWEKAKHDLGILSADLRLADGKLALARASFERDPKPDNEARLVEIEAELGSVRRHYERADRIEKSARERAEQATRALDRLRAREASARDAAAWQARKKELRAGISESAAKLVAYARELARDGQIGVIRELQGALRAALGASDGVEIGEDLGRAVLQPRYPDRSKLL